GDQVPFWLQMNQLGVFNDSDQFQQLFLLNWYGVPQKPSDDKLQFYYGANVLGRISEHSVFRFNEYWARLTYKKWYFHVGAKAEPVFADGLSLTNGNLFLSNNARPNPRIGVGTDNFKFTQNGWFSRFSFDAEYNEYLLQDKRVDDGVHLHHKRLDVHYTIAPKWVFSAGIDHWVFWGGTVPSRGNHPSFKMPGLKDYFRYILGRTGSSSAPETDQLNVEGNQLGQYLFSLQYNGMKSKLKMYYGHLWEDRSGIQFENAPDGLWGIYWKRLQPKPFLKSMVVEYVNTRDQSGMYHKYTPDPVNRPNYQIGEGRDNYFNHGLYKSGFVSYNRMMGLPLFIPQINDQGFSDGFLNTRLWGIHEGMNGWLTKQIDWKTKVTYSKHYGLYGQEYPTPKQFFSASGQIGYRKAESPFAMAMKLAWDHGAILDSGFGAELILTYQIQ
ncbi:MAG TPA: capsule assembly Wzi family protein, partial [Sunxiuqinia sp.]|nr:capsule assembly Wzi family protein [Sunxiuqinia sp.]